MTTRRAYDEPGMTKGNGAGWLLGILLAATAAACSAPPPAAQGSAAPLPQARSGPIGSSGGGGY